MGWELCFGYVGKVVKPICPIFSVGTLIPRVIGSTSVLCSVPQILKADHISMGSMGYTAWCVVVVRMCVILCNPNMVLLERKSSGWIQFY